MPKVISAHNKDQRELYRLQREVLQCGSTKNRQLNAARAPQRNYFRFGSYHRRCRHHEGRRYTSMTRCLSQQRSLLGIKRMRCAYYRTQSGIMSNTNRNRQIVTKAGGESPGNFIKRVTGSFTNQDYWEQLQYITGIN